MNPTPWPIVLACAAIVAGCVPLPPPEPEAQPRAEPPRAPAETRPGIAPNEVENLLSYYQQVRGLSGADLGREHESARQAFSRSRSDFNRVRYAMVLSLPNTGFNDEGRALELLEPVSRNTAGALHGLAYLLVAQLQERKRLDASVQGLQQKLDALKSLERSMIERKR